MDRFLNTFRILEEEEELAAMEREQHELRDMEEEAFLPGSNNGPRKKRKDTIFTRWMPPRMKKFFENASRIKLVIAATIAFLLFLGSISYLNKKYKLPVSLPEESLLLSKELAEKMSGTAIPEYVLTYAPLVFLDKKETFFPSDLATHLSNTYAAYNFTPIVDAPSPLTLDNLNLMNPIRGEDVWLSSTSPLAEIPSFLHGQKPGVNTLQTQNATSSVIILVDKSEGVVDAFYMYFYSFNNGPSALRHQAGNHLGDWEHSMIRFQDGIPRSIWYSQHEYGAAYQFGAVDKIGERPVVFSARGTHANYATANKHDFHDIDPQVPKYIVYDMTSPGELWDPTLQAFWYSFNTESGEFSGVGEKDGIPETPENYLYFKGRWGDQQFTQDMPEQQEFRGFWKWVGGPKGPLDKYLDREDVCLPFDGEKERKCVIKGSI